MGLVEEKLRAREQWSQDPCGAEYDREHELGTREFFDAIERHRYGEYAAWMPRLMEFEKFRGARLLEVGCGMGTDLLQFARAGARCTGMDLTPRSIEITRHRFKLYGADGDFMISDGERLPFRDETFDVVYSNGVLHHTPDTAGAIRELHRVLRRSGVAKVMLYHRNSLNYWVEIVLRRGLLGMEFLRGRSAEEIMSRVIEHSGHDAQPLVKVYSRKEARELFGLFRDVQVEVEQLTRAELRFLAPVVSASMLDRLREALECDCDGDQIIVLNNMLLSVIVPCYNEEDVLRATHERLSNVLRDMPELDYELIFVNDGSRDLTQQILTQLQLHDPRVRVLLLSRNFGHQIAVTAGLEEAAGDAVVIIDADLQDPPEVIPEMVHLWREGNDVVYGIRTDRHGESRFKLWTAKAFYRLINRLSETKMPLDAGDFRLLDRKVVEVIKTMPERARFLRGMVSWAGFRQISIPYDRAARHAGDSKYPLRKMIHFAMDGIISFSLAPLKLAIWTGFLAIWIAVAGIIVAIIDRLLEKNLTRGWASLFVAVLFMGGVQLVSLGILGEYLGRIYTEVKRRPLYVVQERLGFADQSKTAPNTLYVTANRD